MNSFSVGVFARQTLATVLLATACGSVDEEESVASPGQPQSVLHVSDSIAEYAASIGGTAVWGEGTKVHGSPILTWGILSTADGSILAAGVTFGMEIVEDMPKLGDGPAGAIASLQFPKAVRDTTYFEHLEIQPVPDGHVTSPLVTTCGGNLQRNSRPHFDFHFYAIPENDVWPIPACPSSTNTACPSRLPPAQDALLPVGYPQPGASLAQMGRHSSPWSALCDPGLLSADMIAGFLLDASMMHFIEPMISQERLLQREDFELATPIPKYGALDAWAQSFGRSMMYPKSFKTRFYRDTCTMIFSDFISVP